jgi:hypothetical protein
MKVQPASLEMRDELARMLKFLRSKNENLTREKSQHKLARTYDCTDGITLRLLRWILEEHKEYKNNEYLFSIEDATDYDGYHITYLNSYRLGYISDLEYYEEVKARYTAVNGLSTYAQAVIEFQTQLKQQGVKVEYHEAMRMYQAAVNIYKEKYDKEDTKRVH